MWLKPIIHSPSGPLTSPPTMDQLELKEYPPSVFSLTKSFFVGSQPINFSCLGGADLVDGG
ncbi:hypothetical protein Syun_029574 [Stephania yunnanensis]|uniref:Uncharacterized protein n=1 Tax=Stephania yunnanensis TaxID=152371 RepID=A0AAP0HLH8_9MAGN